jgi:hypothetical protein
LGRKNLTSIVPKIFYFPRNFGQHETLIGESPTCLATQKSPLFLSRHSIGWFILVLPNGARRVPLMTSENSDLVERLQKGPSFLMLGQSYLSLTGRDTLLDETVRRYNPSAQREDGYFGILEGSLANAGDASFAWMDNQCRRLTVPDWLSTVSEFSWSGVYTSAIDSLLPSAFRKPWRSVQPIVDEQYVPSDPRNRSVLHLTYLFGSVNHTEESTRPPATRFEWSKRRQVAIALARRLPDLVTPIGTLVIEGYANRSDWFLPEDFLPILDAFSPGQVHLFNASEALRQNRDIAYLCKKESLILHSDSLAQLLLAASQEGTLALGPMAAEERSARRVRFAKNSFAVPQELWNQASRSAVIIDENALAMPMPLSEDARYRNFRAFLSGSEGRPDWGAYRRGFAFTRDFQRDLQGKINGRLAKHTLASEPIIVHGQTGTGKTVALAATALSVAEDGQNPVLFIERRSQKPNYSDIDRFCQWAEDEGAPVSLVIWDGMVRPEEYFEFLKRLTSRGRKVVLLGSTYQLSGADASSLNAVQAPAELSKKEQERFAEFLGSFHPSLRDAIARHSSLSDSTFLVALYRMLPPTRSAIRVGVTTEAGFAEEELLRKAAKMELTTPSSTLLEQQLRKAGLITSEPLFSEFKSVIGTESVTEIQRLTGLVMVPGKFGIRVPLELLLRTLGKRDILRTVKVFEGIDIFRWSEDIQGNIEIGPRNALEAQLIVQSRMGGPQNEIQYANSLLLALKDSGGGSTEGREITFGVDLVRAMGPQGDSGFYYSPFFKDLAQTLRMLRETRGVNNPRIMLQEANLLREWAMLKEKTSSGSVDIEPALAAAEGVVKQALDLLGATKNRHLKNSLFNELTATLAARARLHTTDPTEALHFFSEAQGALKQARRQDPDSYYPVDILAWFTKDMLKAGVLDDRAQTELLADALAAFQTAESMELDIEQKVLLQSRRMDIAALLQWHEMEESAFRALEEAGSTAGFYLRALKLSGLPKSADNLNAANHEKIQKAMHFLQGNYAKVSQDARCLDLLFDLWWISNTGRKIFSSERVTVAFGSDLWSQCLAILEDIDRTGDSQRPLTVAFFRGLAHFHLNQLEAATQTFKELDRESERTMGRRRIVRSYIASTPEGQPRKFHGTVAWASSEGNRGAVHVEELRRSVDFIPRDFGRAEIEKGASLGEFHIAFNFVGPLADPVTMHKR